MKNLIPAFFKYNGTYYTGASQDEFNMIKFLCELPDSNDTIEDWIERNAEVL